MRDVDTFDRALRAGGDDFLTTRIESAELVTRVKSALKLRGVWVELLEHYVLLKQQRDAAPATSAAAGACRSCAAAP